MVVLYQQMFTASTRTTYSGRQNQLGSIFFNHRLFENYFFQNIDRLFHSPSWKTYKQDFKNYIYSYHPDADYCQHKCKENSGGYSIFADKKSIDKKQENIMELSNGTIIRTDNLPFLSKFEYKQKYQNQLDYLSINDF
jgi:hypothetical protein